LIEENPKRGNVHPPEGGVDDGWMDTLPETDIAHENPNVSS